MEVYIHDGKRKLFDEEICLSENIYFHGTHADNTLPVEREGIKRPRYPQPVLDLVKEYKKICLTLGLSHALKTYDYTYKGKQDIIFLANYCSSAAGYVKSKGGEKINTLLISIHNLRLLVEDDKHFNKQFRIAKKRYEIAPYGEKKSCEMSLKAFNNIHQYKPLLIRSKKVIETYPQFFKAKSNKGVVYAVHANGLDLEDQGAQGISTDYVPVKNIIAKSTFEMGAIRNPCKLCNMKDIARKGIQL